jgi:hypothetical protein
LPLRRRLTAFGPASGYLLTGYLLTGYLLTGYLP